MTTEKVVFIVSTHSSGVKSEKRNPFAPYRLDERNQHHSTNTLYYSKTCEQMLTLRHTFQFFQYRDYPNIYLKTASN